MDRNEFSEFCGSHENFDTALNVILMYTGLMDVRRMLELNLKSMKKVLELYEDEGVLLEENGIYRVNYDIIEPEGPAWCSFYIRRCVNAQQAVYKYNKLRFLIEEKFGTDRIEHWMHKEE